jgi:hypothetical protein
MRAQVGDSGDVHFGAVEKPKCRLPWDKHADLNMPVCEDKSDKFWDVASVLLFVALLMFVLAKYFRAEKNNKHVSAVVADIELANSGLNDVYDDGLAPETQSHLENELSNNNGPSKESLV